MTLIEGAVVNEENLHQLLLVRKNTKMLVAFGDCAVTGNVPAIRNSLGNALPVLDRAYRDARNLNPRIPEERRHHARGSWTRSCPCTRSSRSTPSSPAALPRPTSSTPLLLDAVAGKVPSFAGQAIFG